MNAASIALLSLVSLMLAGGQIMFRSGARDARPVEDFPTLIGLLISPTIIAAVALYGVATVLYVIALQRVQLSVAYPFMALGYIVVPLAGYFLLGEAVSLRYAMGVVLILAGLYLAVS